MITEFTYYKPKMEEKKTIFPPLQIQISLS